MEFDWITPREAAEEWGITDRRVQVLCKNGQVDGAIRIRSGWFIPKGTSKPPDGRVNNKRQPAKNKAEDKSDVENK
jgi:hypothetical protein